ncbi:hypothetical protein AHF37_12637 [Paragonimus kellicotti]|nr:hypothetical protein AHF37_12637 [Paragonimus kellicotti]
MSMNVSVTSSLEEIWEKLFAFFPATENLALAKNSFWNKKQQIDESVCQRVLGAELQGISSKHLARASFILQRFTDGMGNVKTREKFIRKEPRSMEGRSSDCVYCQRFGSAAQRCGHNPPLRFPRSRGYWPLLDKRIEDSPFRGNGISSDPAKVREVQEWPTPSSPEEVRKFLGLAGYYRRFVRCFAWVAAPPHRLSEKGRRLNGQMSAKMRLILTQGCHNGIDSGILKYLEGCRSVYPGYRNQ